MSTELWLNPSAGAAGDMLLASLIDLGADERHVRAQLGLLGLDGWSLSFDQVQRCGLTATLATVAHGEGHHHRSWSTIDALIADAGLADAVADGARRTFRALAVAEASVHGIDVDEVHFHEVGAVDAIVDIVGVWAALDSLQVGRVTSAPVGLGSGTTAMAHGTVPVPAPAVLNLLTGVPVMGVDLAAETVTPTGAALLATLVDSWGPPPSGIVTANGRGAGTMDPPGHANVVAAVQLESTSAASSDDPSAAATGESVAATIIECNLDDVSPEVIGHVIERALAEGADDAWATPITMKKSRPGHLLSVLCSPDHVDDLAGLVARETGTLGYRLRSFDKVELPRSVATVTVDGHPVRIKVGPHSAKPEHDDVAAVASATGRTHRDIASSALAEHRRSKG